MSTTPTDATTDRRRAQRRESRAKSKALELRCWCGAQVAEPCWQEGDKTRGIHALRVLAAHGLDAKGKAL